MNTSNTVQFDTVLNMRDESKYGVLYVNLSLSGGLFWPWNNIMEHPDAEWPEKIIQNPPPATADEEEEEEINVVGLDDEEELQVPEPRRPDEGEEEIDVAVLDHQEVRQMAKPQRDDGGAESSLSCRRVQPMLLLMLLHLLTLLQLLLLLLLLMLTIYDPPDDASAAQPLAADPDEISEFQIPQLEPETLGSLTSEECVELFSSDGLKEEDPTFPFTSPRM
ncbi:circumsporozoite protein-like [Xyrichtys novacula]|uniref:Circumsporozoite protein-like n=1 Tax=Xyrichtys novacula TaxID=13765 RepID=A0AAV1F3L6_XYRNO|nr:circumsporozoite protein-like [Xyrichtys novacula]